jgi:hypothetical protein
MKSKELQPIPKSVENNGSTDLYAAKDLPLAKWGGYINSTHLLRPQRRYEQNAPGGELRGPLKETEQVEAGPTVRTPGWMDDETEGFRQREKADALSRSVIGDRIDRPWGVL